MRRDRDHPAEGTAYPGAGVPATEGGRPRAFEAHDDERAFWAGADTPVAEPVRPRRRAGLLARLRIGLGFAFLVSLLVHSTLLALFVGGTAPGAVDGQEAIAVDIITQEQLDALLGEGSSQGGKPRKVDDSGNGTEAALRQAAPSAPQRSESEAERREAPNVVTATEASEQMPVGTSERVNPATGAVPRKSETKSRDRASPAEAAPARRTDPKDRPDSEREDARTQAPPVEARPGADGGQARRTAARGGVGEELGPLPPSMRQALMQQLQRQIEACYVPPAGFGATSELPLVLIRFHRDGSLNGLPRSQRFERTLAGKAMVQAALKAVRQCAPYRMPPRFAPYYEDWKEIRAEFEFSHR